MTMGKKSVYYLGLKVRVYCCALLCAVFVMLIVILFYDLTYNIVFGVSYSLLGLDFDWK